jgi:type III secretory pathway component EscT
VSPVLLAPWLPQPSQLERAFAPFADVWGVRHGGMDAATLFFLVLLRWVGIVQLCPFLGGRLVPGPVKMGLAMLMAWFSTPWLSHQLPVPLSMSAARFWTSMFHELAIGLLIGFGSSLVFLAAQMGGEFLDGARGTTSANMLVPQLQVQASLLGDFYFQLFIVLYVLAGGHRWFFQAALDSYRVFPPTGTMPGAEIVNESFIHMGVLIFGIMIKVVAPAILVIILVDVVLGVANRMAPQMDVFFLGLALKPALGLLIVAVSLYGLLGVTPDVFRSFHAWMGSWLNPPARP